VPLFFVPKKDKKYWNNLMLTKEIYLKINSIFAIYSKDFDSGNIIEF
jgi:hypothetical protein